MMWYRASRKPLDRGYSGTLGPARTLAGSCSRRAALRREQRERLESNHCENRVTGKEGETDQKHHKHNPRYASKLLGTKSLKEGLMCHIDLLLSNDHKANNETRAVTRQRPALSNGSTVGSGVFYVVRSESISLDQQSSVQLVHLSAQI
jgi:hypothetical protein